MLQKILFQCLIISSSLNAQHVIISPKLHVEVDSILKKEIYTSLDSLYAQISIGKITDTYILSENSDLAKSVFSYLRGIEKNEEKNIPNYYKKELINLYQIDHGKFFLDIAYTGYDENESRPEIRMIVNMMAKVVNEKVKFSLPLASITKAWKTKEIGKIKYYYRDSINIQNAQLFNSKNTLIAEKMGWVAENFNFFICQNYQEIMMLLGIKYDLSENGKTENGYGVDSGNILSVRSNEDFSHDIFHYYSGKVNERKNRNWVAEEGIAYSWGNAYYVDSKGEMIIQELLIDELKNYLNKYPKTSLLTLFEEDTKIFNHISPKISVRSTISSLLCDEIERKKGITGIFEIINSGKRSTNFENFLQTLDRLIAINRNNFDQKVAKLIHEYLN